MRRHPLPAPDALGASMIEDHRLRPRQKGRTPRVGLVAVVALAHLAVLWIVAGAAHAPKAAPDRAVEIGLVGAQQGDSAAAYAVSAHAAIAPPSPTQTAQPIPERVPADQAAAPPPPRPEQQTASPSPDAPDLTAQPLELDPAAAADLAARAAKATLGTGDRLEAACGIADRIGRALQSDVGVQAALATVPPRSRSVANAISVWNDGWTAPDEIGGAEVADPLKRAIFEQIGAISPECRLQPLKGPRLITLQGGRGPTTLAVGSGAWRWADLLR